MKTANELAQEYYAKTPMERLHTTLQDYVYDYQQEIIDNLNTQLVSIKDRYILRGQEINLLNNKIYEKDQIIDACLYSDDEEDLE